MTVINVIGAIKLTIRKSDRLDNIYPWSLYEVLLAPDGHLCCGSAAGKRVAGSGGTFATTVGDHTAPGELERLYDIQLFDRFASSLVVFLFYDRTHGPDQKKQQEAHSLLDQKARTK